MKQVSRIADSLGLGLPARWWRVPRGTIWERGSKREMFHVEQTPSLFDLGLSSKMELAREASILPSESRKFSTARTSHPSLRPFCKNCHEALPAHTFASWYPVPPQGAFHSFALFSTCQLATLASLFPFTLECHGQDSRHRQPKGRSWKNHYCDKSVCVPGA